MKGKRLRQVQGHGDQQGEGKSTASRAILCPAQLVGHKTMPGLGALTLYSPSCLSLRVESLKEPFLFFLIRVPLLRPLAPSCSQHPQGPVQLSTTLSSTPPDCLTSPLTDAGSSMILDPSRSRLPQPPLQYSLPPFPNLTERKDRSPATTFPSASPPRLPRPP